MNNRFGIFVAIIIGLMAITGPIVLSIYLAWQQSLNEQLSFVESVALDVLRRTED